MSSSLGGFYISALNDRQKHKFELSQRVHINIAVCFEFMGKELLSDSCDCDVGEDIEISGNDHSINIQTTILDSGLLKAVCSLHNNDLIGKQEFNLSPSEPASSMIEGNKDMRITVLAKPTTEDINN